MMKYRGIELEEQDSKYWFSDRVLSAQYSPEELPAHDRMDTWMARVGVHKSTGYWCLGKVLHGRGHTCRWPCYDQPDTCSVEQDGWFDHVQLFWLPGAREYILTSQPYDVTLEKFKAMERFAALHGLAVSISIEDAWHYPGATPLIVWSKAGENDRISA